MREKLNLNLNLVNLLFRDLNHRIIFQSTKTCRWMLPVLNKKKCIIGLLMSCHEGFKVLVVFYNKYKFSSLQLPLYPSQWPGSLRCSNFIKTGTSYCTMNIIQLYTFPFSYEWNMFALKYLNLVIISFFSIITICLKNSEYIYFDVYLKTFRLQHFEITSLINDK